MRKKTKALALSLVLSAGMLATNASAMALLPGAELDPNAPANRVIQTETGMAITTISAELLPQVELTVIEGMGLAAAPVGDYIVPLAGQYTAVATGFVYDTGSVGGVQVRVVTARPLDDGVVASGWLAGAEHEGVRGHFERFFTNNFRVIRFDHIGEFGQTVSVGARVNLQGMEAANLVFYSYDRNTNTFFRLQNPNPRVDALGFLLFETAVGGTIVISEGPLVARETPLSLTVMMHHAVREWTWGLGRGVINRPVDVTPAPVADTAAVTVTAAPAAPAADCEDCED